MEANASKKRVHAFDRMREDIPTFEKRDDELTVQVEKADLAKAAKPADDRLPERLSKSSHRRDELRRTMDFREGMRACMRSGFGRKARCLRGTTVEPVIGWIKDTIGFRRP